MSPCPLLEMFIHGAMVMEENLAMETQSIKQLLAIYTVFVPCDVTALCTVAVFGTRDFWLCSYLVCISICHG